MKQIRKKVGSDRVMMIGAGVIIYKGREVLLQKRRDDLSWSYHGGGVEMGEKVEIAAKRELFEETGLIANKLELFGVFSGDNGMHTYPDGNEVYIVSITYICCDFSGEMLPETDETLELKWFDIDDLPEDIFSPDVDALNAFAGYIKSL